jgi:opacity protein-like surface antigen
MDDNVPTRKSKRRMLANRTHFAGSDNHTAVLIGAGASLAMNRNWGMRLEYDDFASSRRPAAAKTQEDATWD